MKRKIFHFFLTVVMLCFLFCACGSSKEHSIGTDLNETQWGYSFKIAGLANTVCVYEFYGSLDRSSGKAHLTINTAGYFITDEYGNFTVDTKNQTISYSSSERTINFRYDLTNDHISGLAILKDDGSLGATLMRIG